MNIDTKILNKISGNKIQQYTVKKLQQCQAEFIPGKQG